MHLLDEPLHIFRDGSIPHDGGGSNRGLDALMGYRNNCGTANLGNIVIMKVSAEHRPFYVDMDTKDVCHAREFFLHESSVPSIISTSTSYQLTAATVFVLSEHA